MPVIFLDDHLKQTYEVIVIDFIGFARKGGVMYLGQILVRAHASTLSKAVPFVVAGLDKVVE